MMAITADKVRTLAAQGERSTVDFKRDDYSWNLGRASTNAELAKDLMAMANVLAPNSAPAYILIGVENDGQIVGIPRESHFDDAVLHQKVRNLLNRTPVFSYSMLEMDGMSLGVYEILPGGRPYFPIRDSPPLMKSVAMFRDGTATERASPDMILDWAQQDDPEAHEIRLLQRRQLEASLTHFEADAKVVASLHSTGVIEGSDIIDIHLEVRNQGRSGFYVTRCDWTIVWNADKIKQTYPDMHVPDDYSAPSGTIDLGNTLIRPGQVKNFQFKWTRNQAIPELSRMGVSGASSKWANYYFAIRCRGELDNRSDIAEYIYVPEATAR